RDRRLSSFSETEQERRDNQQRAQDAREKLRKLRVRLTKGLEAVFGKFALSYPKYLDRSDLAAEQAPQLGVFQWIMNSDRSFDDLLSEISTVVPPSVFRNYLLLHLLAREAKRMDPSLQGPISI